MPKSDMVQSLLKALDILDLVSASVDGIRLNEVVDALDLRKSTAHNLMRTLMSRGYLEQDLNHRVLMGGAVQELWLRRERMAVFQRAEQVVRHLHSLHPAGTVNFCELIGSEISCRMRMSADCPGLLRRPRTHVLNPYASASGLCLQAFNANYRERMDALHPLDESSQHFWKSFQEFTDARKRAVNTGVAVIRAGMRLRIAAPVSDVFSIGLQQEAGDEMLEALCTTIREAALEIAGLPDNQTKTNKQLKGPC